jgi:integrase
MVNPWKTVRKPMTDKQVKPVPTEDQTAHFFAWVKSRYPKWESLHALLELKAFSSCRTGDICELRSDQIQAGRVVWNAEQTKQREGRSVLLPEEMFKTLKRLAGKVYLWEQFADDLAKFRRSKNRKAKTFTPETVYHVIGNVFREYSDAHPDRPRLSPHSLRRRGITLTVAATQSVDATAAAIGITPACAKEYYVNAQRAFNTDELFRNLSSVLLPKKAQTEVKMAPQIPRKSGNKPAFSGTTRNNKKSENARKS